MTPDWPGDVEPLPRHVADDRLGKRLAELGAADRCHCGEPVVWGYDGNTDHHRGMCKYCDLVRCDAYPGECGRRNEDRP